MSETEPAADRWAPAVCHPSLVTPPRGQAQLLGCNVDRPPSLRLPLTAASPSTRRERWKGLPQRVQICAPLAGRELAGLTCRSAFIQLMDYRERAEVLEMIVCCSAQFVEWPLGGTRQPVMTKSGLEAKSHVTKGVVSRNA